MSLLRTIFLTLFYILRITASADLSHSQFSFADSLTSLIFKDENECSSSLGLSMCMSLVYPGSTGITKSQIRDVFGFPDDQMQLVWDKTITSLNAVYDGTLAIANSIWIDDGLVLTPSYSRVAGKYIKRTDFNSDSAAAAVNEWVEKSTRGLIKEILNPGPILSKLVAINSIYLNAKWKEPFETEFTNQDAFYTDSSRSTSLSSEAQFMHRVGVFLYSESAIPGYQVLQIPYENSKLSMTVVLPVQKGLPSVNTTGLMSALPKLKSRRIALALPKFKFQSSYSKILEDSLKKLGVVAAFDRGFEHIANSRIEKIVQKTSINCMETGTEAAAVSAVSLSYYSYHPTPPSARLVQADHPFQFFIYDRGQNVVLFEGRIGNPKPPSRSRAPLKGKHSDRDFWERFDVEEVTSLATAAKPAPEADARCPIVVDVRPRGRFEAGHAPCAHWFRFHAHRPHTYADSLASIVRLAKGDKGFPVRTYGDVDRDATSAARALRAAGLTRAESAGGWKKSSTEIADLCECDEPKDGYEGWGNFLRIAVAASGRDTVAWSALVSISALILIDALA